MSRFLPKPARAGAALTLAILFAAGGASANGRYPFGNQIVVDPHDNTHMIARATFGLVETNDGNKSWGWICEGAVGYAPLEDPFIGITATGTILAASTKGMFESHDYACGWSSPSDLPSGQIFADLVVERGDPSHALTISSTYVGGDGGGGFQNVLYETLDAGASWHPIGTPLPTDLLVTTLEIAPSDPNRLYVSAIRSSSAVLERSKDRGTTWETITPNWETANSAWISAVDPTDPDRVYVRLKPTAGPPTQGAQSEAAGVDRLGVITGADATWKDLLTGIVRATDESTGAPVGLVAFALSPDGKQVAVGGYDDNLHVIATDTWVDQKVNDIHPLCLTWTSDGLYACGFFPKDLFVVGRSCDDGKTFEHLLEWEHFCPLSCPAGTSTGDTCPAVWNGPPPNGFKASKDYDDKLCLATGVAPSTDAELAREALLDAGVVDATDPFACGAASAGKDADTDANLPNAVAANSGGCGCRFVGAQRSGGGGGEPSNTHRGDVGAGGTMVAAFIVLMARVRGARKYK